MINSVFFLKLLDHSFLGKKLRKKRLCDQVQKQLPIDAMGVASILEKQN